MTIIEFLDLQLSYDHPNPNADLARAERELMAKRRILDLYPAGYDIGVNDSTIRVRGRRPPSKEVILALASVYSDSPDYQPEWALS